MKRTRDRMSKRRDTRMSKVWDAEKWFGWSKEDWELLQQYLDKARAEGEFDCIGCGFDVGVEDYMITDEVWNLTGVDHDGGFLCIGCVEDRIGRQLNSCDFTDAPINEVEFILPGTCIVKTKSDRLINRLTTTKEKK